MGALDERGCAPVPPAGGAPPSQLGITPAAPAEASCLLSRLPGRSVAPLRYDAGSACYDGWLPPPLRQGMPHVFGGGGSPAARTLWGLLAAEGVAPGEGSAGPPLRLALVGFSKGAVVLHQVHAAGDWECLESLDASQLASLPPCLC